MSKNTHKFNITQGMTLLLIKELSLPPSLVFQIILYVTDPINSVGSEN
tara:strand:+ start:272 stop:415 length:144 start_codon:yes stop_codon:yes gene_type:complete